MSKIAFKELRDAVVNEAILATNAYLLLTGLALPQARQSLLHEHYPFIVENFVRALTEQVLMTVCRLFDPKKDRRLASLSNFLRGVVPEHGRPTDVPPEFALRRVEFEQGIPGFLAEIATRWKTLSRHRNAYLAHRDLSAVALADITHHDIRECFGLAQDVVGGYCSAYEDATQTFHLAGLKEDLPRFLKWCRLDDYERHFNEDMRLLERRLREESHP